MQVPLLKGSKSDALTEWRDSLPVNMVGITTPVLGAKGYMRTAEGLVSFGAGSGVDRGGVWNEKQRRHYRVSGDKLIEVKEFGGASEELGTIPGSSQVSLPYSFNSQGIVVHGGSFYVYDPSGPTLTEVPDPDDIGFIDGVWIDGYYFLTNGERIFNTTLADETVISPISFAASDFSPDPIFALDRSTDNKLIAFNRYTTERFYNAGNPQNFPFSRIPNAAVPVGVVGTHCRVRIGDGGWVILGGSKEYSPGFYQFSNSYGNITNREIEAVLDEYSDFELTGAVLEYRDTREQELVICRLPRNTLVYDITMSRYIGEPTWYIFKTGNSVWRARNGVYDPRGGANRRSSWIYGDAFDNRLGELDKDLFTQYDELQTWELVTPLIVTGGASVSLRMKSLPGRNRIDENPSLFLSSTKDGFVYGSESPISMGGKGDYQFRIYARNIGNFEDQMGLKFRGKNKTPAAFALCEITDAQTRF